MLGKSPLENAKVENLPNPKDLKTRRSLNIEVKDANQTPKYGR